MAYLQFFSGSRDQELQQLDDAASLTVGNAAGPGVHVVVSDPGIEARHCQIYPAQGSFWLQNFSPDTIIDKRRVPPNATEQLQDKSVFILGRTYVKFWKDKPPAASGGGGGGDDAALSQTRAQLAEVQAELERLQAAGSDAEKARAEAEEQRRAAKASHQELETLRAELKDLQREMASAKRAREEAEGKVHQAEAQATQARADAETARAEGERRLASAREDAERERERAVSEAVAQAVSEAEARAGTAQQALEAERDELRGALSADREALAALRSQVEAPAHDSLAALQAPSDLSLALDALDVAPSLRLRLEAALRAEVDREVLRRTQGPVVPVRGLRVPGCAADVETALRAAQERARQLRAVEELGLAGLEAAELERLLEAARS